MVPISFNNEVDTFYLSRYIGHQIKAWSYIHDSLDMNFIPYVCTISLIRSCRSIRTFFSFKGQGSKLFSLRLRETRHCVWCFQTRFECVLIINICCIIISKCSTSLCSNITRLFAEWPPPRAAKCSCPLSLNSFPGNKRLMLRCARKQARQNLEALRGHARKRHAKNALMF